MGVFKHIKQNTGINKCVYFADTGMTGMMCHDVKRARRRVSKKAGSANACMLRS